jgi:hypothetical protein
VEDHHVDRPGVEVRQRMKLTGTNRSFGLIALIYQCPLAISAGRLPTERPVTRYLCFAGLVALAWGLNPIPFRTRPLNPSAPMVLSLKAWESRSLPGLPSTDFETSHGLFSSTPRRVAYRKPRRGGRWLKGQVAETGKSRHLLFSDFRPQNCRGVEQSGSSSGS